jgi:protein involved in polysaccharide export with SLBB domain
MAGGFTDWAKEQRKIFVVRKENGREKKLTVDYNKAMKGDDPGSNVFLKPGDTIVVEGSIWEKPRTSYDDRITTRQPNLRRY